MRRSQWTDPDGQRLAIARRRHGDTQTGCAKALRQLGAEGVTQGTVSSWERARTGPVARTTLDAIAEYCAILDDVKEVRAVDNGSAESSVESGATPGQRQTGIIEVDATDFTGIVAGLTGDRVLSERQSRFVDGLIYRLREGPPMSPDDGATVRSLLALLRLENG